MSGSVFCVGFSIVALLSSKQGGCGALRRVAQTPRNSTNNLTQRLPLEVSGSIIREAIDECMVNDKHIDTVTRDSFHHAQLLINDARNAVEKIRLQSEGKNEVNRKLSDLYQLQSTMMMNPETIMHESMVFISPRILLSGTQNSSLTFKNDGIMTDFLNRQVELANAKLKSFDSTWPEFKHQMTVYSIIDHLNEVQKFGESIGCENIVFCVQLDGEQCSNIGSGRKLTIPNGAFKNVPIFKRSEMKFTLDLNKAFAIELASNKCSIDYKIESDSNKNGFNFNNFYIGLYILNNKVEAFKRVTPSILVVMLLR